MHKIRYISSNDEVKKAMQSNIKPITMKHRGSKIPNISIPKSAYWLMGLLLIALLISGVSEVIEAHSTSPQLAIGDGSMRRSEYTASRGGSRIMDIDKYDANGRSIIKSLGDRKIVVNGKKLMRYDLPDEYYNKGFSLFQTLVYYNSNTIGKSNGLNIINNEKLFVDENGFMRHNPNKDQFTINNKPDYVLSAGIISRKDIQGNRYLVITNGGMYTIITDDEKFSMTDYYGNPTPRFSGLRGSDTTEKVYNFLKDRGCSHAAAVGILGNMYQESGINPNKVNPDGGASGIVQWKDGRFNKLVNFAGERGRSWTDLESQLEFMWIELHSNDIDSRMRRAGGIEGFKTLNDIDHAVSLFEIAFERSGGSAMQSRHRAAYSIDEKMKVKNKPVGLVKWIVFNSGIEVNIRDSKFTNVLQSKIICIYKIE